MALDFQGIVIPIRPLIFEGIVLCAAVIFFCFPAAIVAPSPTTSTRVRLLSFTGVVVTAPLIVLGGVWPSYYTILAILAAPAPFLFLALIFRPVLIEKWPRLRFYLLSCVAASALAWAFQLLWNLHG